jgi:hypothetical protein
MLSSFDIIRNQNIEYISQIELPKKEWGQDCNQFAATNQTMNYLFGVIIGFGNGFGNVMTSSVTFDHTNNQGMIDLLCATYRKIIAEKGKCIIYTPINVSSNSNPNMSHQNWICLDSSKNLLQRFEPSENYVEFGITPICEQICRQMGVQCEEHITNLTKDTQIFGCRVVSTLITCLYLLGIDISFLLSIKKNKKSQLLLKIIYHFDQEIKSAPIILKNYNTTISRSTSVLNYYSLDSIKKAKAPKKKVVKSKAASTSPKVKMAKAISKSKSKSPKTKAKSD